MKYLIIDSAFNSYKVNDYNKEDFDKLYEGQLTIIRLKDMSQLDKSGYWLPIKNK